MSIPRNPRPPKPKFVTVYFEAQRTCIYGWKCEAHDVVEYSDSQHDIQSKWLESFKRRYHT